MKLGDRVSLSFLAYLDAAFIGVFLQRYFWTKRGKDQDHLGAKINVLKNCTYIMLYTG